MSLGVKPRTPAGSRRGREPVGPRRLIGALVSATLLFAVPGHAQKAASTLPADPTLTRLIRESLQARPELARAQAVVRAEQERVPQAGALPDPMVQLGIQNDGFTSIEIGKMEGSYISLMVSQTLPWPGKRRLGQEVAELAGTQAKLAVERLRLSTEAEVRRSYLVLVLVRDRLQLLDALEVVWQTSSALARIRYETGGGAQSDVLRAQLELNRLKQRRIALHAEERSRVQALNRLRGHPLDEPIATSSHIRDLAKLSAYQGRFSSQAALRRSPELAAARLGVTRAARSVALAEKTYYPDLTVGAGIMYRGALPPMWLATVGAPLPLFAGSKQSRAVAESRAWSSAAESEVTAVEQLLRLRTAERHTAFSALLQTIELYEQGLLVQSQATSESTLAQYQVGKVSFASVLEANAGLIGDQEGYLRAIAAAHDILIAEAEISFAPTALPAAGGGSAAMPGAGAMTVEGSSGSAPGAEPSMPASSAPASGM